MTDDRFEFVPVADFERVAAHLARWGTVDSDDGDDPDHVTARAGAATFTVTRDGDVDAGMPLHELSRGDVTELGFDHDAEEILVRGDDFRYVFRKP